MISRTRLQVKRYAGILIHNHNNNNNIHRDLGSLGPAGLGVGIRDWSTSDINDARTTFYNLQKLLKKQFYKTADINIQRC